MTKLSNEKKAKILSLITSDIIQLATIIATLDAKESEIKPVDVANAVFDAYKDTKIKD